MRKIDIPFVWRHVGTLCQVTEVAEIAMIHDLPVVLFGNAVHLHGVGFVDQVEKSRKRVTQADTATAAVTDVIDTFQFAEKVILVVERRFFPVEGMPGRSLKAPFSGDCHCR
jgi:hypothetical protein